GLVEHEEVDGRKVYRLTDAGREELRRNEGELRDLEEELAHSVRALAREVRSEVHESVQGLRDELKQAAREVRRESRAHARTQGRGGVWADGRVESIVAEVTERLGVHPRAAMGGLAKDLAALTRDVL